MSWRIKQAEFVKSVVDASDAPPERPAAVFAGRSNVGKSSLINRLVGRKSLARTSVTPGRTRLINYFDIDEQYYFIDLPGYGYAKVSKDVQRQWGPMMERFFREGRGLRLVVLILDVRRELEDGDRRMIGWLEQADHPYILAVTKCDKLSRTAAGRRLQSIQAQLGMADDSALVPVSSRTGEGIDALLGVIRAALDAG